MLYGMQEAQISSIASLSHPSGNLSSGLSLDLLDPTDNYGIYRKQITEKPGLPFLHPHISDYQNRGQGAVAHLFPFSVM